MREMRALFLKKMNVLFCTLILHSLGEKKGHTKKNERGRGETIWSYHNTNGKNKENL